MDKKEDKMTNTSRRQEERIVALEKKVAKLEHDNNSLHIYFERLVLGLKNRQLEEEKRAVDREIVRLKMLLKAKEITEKSQAD